WVRSSASRSGIGARPIRMNPLSAPISASRRTAPTATPSLGRAGDPTACPPTWRTDAAGRWSAGRSPGGPSVRRAASSGPSRSVVPETASGWRRLARTQGAGKAGCLAATEDADSYGGTLRDGPLADLGQLAGECSLLVQHTPVVVRHHLHEPFEAGLPVLQQPRRDRRMRVLGMLGHQRAKLDRVGLVDRLRRHAREVAAAVDEVSDLVVDVGDPAGHVLAAVIADPFDDRARAGVAHGEALAREAAEERPPARRAVEHRVADD